MANSTREPVTDAPHDVLVVGGGPAGSTIATLLARRGERVLLVDKDHHPRFHIGESLLPMNVPLFEALGVKDEIASIGIRKNGVELVSPFHQRAQTLDYDESWDRNFNYSYEVRRSEFDHILLKNAAAKGAEVIEGCRVTGVEFPAEGGVIARATGDDGQERRFAAKFLVDASGRDTLLASKLDIKTSNRRHHSAAVFGHFTNAWRQTGRAAGNISIFWFDHGWIWYIPLADGTTSVGAVCQPDFIKSRKTDVTTFFKALIAMSPELSERLRDAELTGPATATGNYSYRAGHMTGPNYILLGDAYAFIDPVFSTGVFLAMQGAFYGAEAVTVCLHQSQAKAARALRRFEAEVKLGLERFTWYIYRMNRPAMRDLLMTPRAPLRIQSAVLSLLAGDVFRPSPIHFRLFLFKMVYYVKTFAAKQGRLLPRFAPRPLERT